MKNYIVGYGSLFNKESVKRTLSSVDYIEPIYLNNYIRSWNAVETKTISFSTTYLGVEKSNNSKINCVLFEIEENLLDDLDKREFLYTRQKVDYIDIEFISNKLNPNKEDNIWIYITNHPSNPSKDYPIIQSYVDTCISGCFELEKEFKIDDFALDFIRTTKNWSKFWVNDRIFPRSPHIYQANAYKIDELIFSEIPNLYKEIIIE